MTHLITNPVLIGATIGFIGTYLSTDKNARKMEMCFLGAVTGAVAFAIFATYTATLGVLATTTLVGGIIGGGVYSSAESVAQDLRIV